MQAEFTILPLAVISPTKETAVRILFKSALLILLGTITVYGLHPLIKASALTCMIALFFMTLRTRQYFTFLMLLFVGSHFVYINQIGGLFNLSAIIALLLLLVFDPSGIRLHRSSFPTSIKVLLALLCVFQLLSVTGGNDFSSLTRILGLFVFATLVILFYFSSKVELTDHHIREFLIVIAMISLYMFIVSINQKYIFIPYNLPFIPLYDQEAQFEYDITRSSGTLLNFEAYAEYCLSVIALIIPGLLTGSLKRFGSRLYWLLTGTVLISMMAIVLSGTRSSMLLLVVLAGLAVFFTRKIRRGTIMLFLLLLSAGYGVNSYFNIVDLDVFRKRSEEINLNSLTLAKIMRGEDINRAETFSLATDEIEKKGGLIGGGYYSSVDDYRLVHFGSNDSGYADFHNLYLSSIVIWGYVGAAAFILLLIFSLVRGIKSYSKSKHAPRVHQDLLLGFNFLFFLFLINQLKIQFIREVNYFMLILILLAIYHTLSGNIHRRINLSSKIN